MPPSPPTGSARPVWPPCPGLDEEIFAWGATIPRASAPPPLRSSRGVPAARRLRAILTRFDGPAPEQQFSAILLRRDPGLLEAVEILIARPEAVRTVLGRFGYTDPEAIGGFLDETLPRGVLRARGDACRAPPAPIGSRRARMTMAALEDRGEPLG